MDRQFKDEKGDTWHVYRQPKGSAVTSPGRFHPSPDALHPPGFRFQNQSRSESRFLKEEDAPKDLNLEKSHEEELRRLLNLATPIQSSTT